MKIKPSDYFAPLFEALQAEKEETRRRFISDVAQKTLKEKIEAGICLSAVRLEQLAYQGMDVWYLRFRLLNRSVLGHTWRVGDALRIVLESAETKDCRGILVRWAEGKEIEVAVSATQLPDFLEEGARYALEQLPDEQSILQMEQAMNIWQQLENPRQKLLFEVLSGQRQPSFCVPKTTQELPSFLNAKQHEAISKILSAHELFLLHGPPGTGKTNTLVQAIKAVAGTERQVLATAPSNTAVDILCERLAAEGLRVLRIGHPARIDEQLWQFTVDAQKQKHRDFKRLKEWYRQAEEYRHLAGKYKRSYGKEEAVQRRLLYKEARQVQQDAKDLEKNILRELVEQAQVICATLVGCAHPLLDGMRFGTVFVDEAAQALEPAVWIPLLKADRLVMAGDHCQLPPTVLSPAPEAQILQQTLFEKLIHAYPEAACMLEIQYRMHPVIMEFPSQHFYKGKLQAAPTLSASIMHCAPPQVITFIDTAGTGFEESKSAEGSFFNEGEARVLYRHLEEEWGRASLSDVVQVGVISPYSAQVALLKELLQSLPLPTRIQLKISTVDSFQGQECEVIYISMVRSNENMDIGFLNDIRRMNVAMTRAKYRLVIIGDSSTVGGHPFYEALLRYVEDIGAYRSAWEWR
ncbi:superfamily I DNA and/or RNA helicase [Thermonema lapsum]|uniref:Superfamily I DNA and/or RNA helicase n=1 Tax=Thermonema lapsum TaxID=28195 RepID=A0A846MT24_9BACT|nr:AAA domain-containing protein [Thermonema lapsum]NIK74746.1 superfamily I DNA and/or RNA helicase [Thermonema lapsum]